ncbi:MAG TPA: hypothetical protein VL117_00860, partial [Thermoleophilia bacterium]|nr:hypothetical protein [Thermoleophilia bacterium]
MRGTVRLSRKSLTLACIATAAAMVAGLVLWAALASAGAAAPTPPVLYAGANSSLGGSVVVG